MRESATFFSLLIVACLLSGCGTSSSATPSGATLVATPVRTSIPAQTSTLTLRVITPTLPVSTQAPNRAEVIFRWDAGVVIADIDDISDLAIHLRDRPGIVDAFGDEIQITVIYDSQLTTPEKIRQILADMGFPTRKP